MLAGHFRPGRGALGTSALARATRFLLCVVDRVWLWIVNRFRISGFDRDAGAGDWDFDDEAGAAGGVVFDPDRAAVFADDLVHDREAEAHARDLCREVRQEELLLVLRADAWTV